MGLLTVKGKLNMDGLTRYLKTFNKRVAVGFPEEIVTDQGIQEKAHSLEYRWMGAGPRTWKTSAEQRNIPEEEYVQWAFLRRTQYDLEGDFGKVIKQLLDEGYTGDAFWHALGSLVEQRILLNMAAGTSPELAPSWIRRKGHAEPRYYTGELEQAVTHVIRGGVNA